MRLLSKLRSIAEEEGIDAILITGNGPHLGENKPKQYRNVEIVSGFTGSSGSLIITKDEALLRTDSRYFIQAEKELEGTEFSLMRENTEGVPTIEEYLSKRNLRTAVDGYSISIDRYKKMREMGIDLVITGDILEKAGLRREVEGKSEIFRIPDSVAGETSEEKIERLRKALRENKADWTLITTLCDIAWITNLRGNDIEYSPLFRSWFFVSEKEAILFADAKEFPEGKFPFSIEPYSSVLDFLREGKLGNGYLDFRNTNATFMFLLKGKIKNGPNPTEIMKARKNEAEIRGMRKAHMLDGEAFARFLASIGGRKGLREADLSDILDSERRKNEGYLEESFAPISGAGENGAVVHYSAKGRGREADGIVVLDTGAHYLFGTTDITRTLSFGKPGEEEKRDYTLVLKGHLAILRQKFIKGTTGSQLDVLAKQFLWNNGMSYFHGTGHGVGHVLEVHEGPERISSALVNVPLEPGMVLSDEPGLYREGRYGIRIENLMVVVKKEETEFGEFYGFENLTLVPYEKDLIEKRLLSEEEIRQIDSYHAEVFEKLKTKLTGEEYEIIRKAAEPL